MDFEDGPRAMNGGPRTAEGDRLAYAGKAATANRQYPSAPPASCGTIPELLNEQFGEVLSMHEAVTMLESRLALVLGPESRDGVGASPKEPEPVHIGERVRMHTRAIGSASRRIQAIADRLQL